MLRVELEHGAGEVLEGAPEDLDGNPAAVLIRGNVDDLGELRDSIDEAIRHGRGEGLLLTDAGTDRLVVERAGAG